MCTNLRSYNIQYRNLRPVVTNKLILPCGRCEECLASRKSDLYIRAFFETVRCLSNGGFCFFETLTYNDYHLPTKKFKVNKYWQKPKEKLRLYLRENSSEVELPYPNYDHIRSFWHRLRKIVFSQLCKQNLCTQRSERGRELSKLVSSNLKYICCTQFGEKEHRPHFHFALWVNLPISNWQLKCAINKAWRNYNGLVSDSLRHQVLGSMDFGMTDRVFSSPKTSKPTLATRNIDFNTIRSFDLSAIGYITRYVIRDTLSDKYHCDLLNVDSPFDLPSELRGRVVCSSNLGYDVFKNFDNYKDYLFQYNIKIDFEKLKITIPSKDKKDSSGFVTLNIPQYYKRKFFYKNTPIFDTRTDEKSYVLQVREPWQMEVPIDSLYDSRLKTFQDSLDHTTQTLEHKYLSLSQKIKDIYDEFSQGVDFQDLAIFKLLIYGKIFSKEIIDNYFTGDGMTDYNSLIYELSTPTVPLCTYESTSHFDEDNIDLLMYNINASHFCFPNYTVLLEILLTSETQSNKVKDARAKFNRVCDEVQKKYI